MVLHILSFYDQDELKTRHLLEEHLSVAGQQVAPRPLLPPWIGTSLKEFLETQGIDAIKKANCWLMRLRFGEPYSAPLSAESCP
ncbi:MAG: hypothetical protein B7Z73_12685 [Planctomycetia bacterium 21-64-5]|nr:MAG: hypothetical protein B7Z73_12685 [Planctomycetia bacterium 21-64-5]HQU44862.1 hypothetical protein [Pirellulales bacterium]